MAVIAEYYFNKHKKKLKILDDYLEFKVEGGKKLFDILWNSTSSRNAGSYEVILVKNDQRVSLLLKEDMTEDSFPPDHLSSDLLGKFCLYCIVSIKSRKDEDFIIPIPNPS